MAGAVRWATIRIRPALPIYEATEDQQLEAFGFYATGGDTEYRLTVKTDFTDKEELSKIEYVQAGYLQYPGFYTIEL